MIEEAHSSDVVYIIVGMHRSGTSSIGRLMESIGFEFGDNLLEGIDSINDRGFWEDRDVVALNEHIFQLYSSSWFDFERLPGKWWEDSKIKDLVGVAETWFQEGFSHEKPIAVKDPRFCRLLPFWKRVFLGMGIRPHILFIIRHPAEVAASIKHRDGFSLQVGYLLWLAYVIDGLYYSRNLDLAIINYESLLANPEQVAKRLLSTDVASLHGLSEEELLTLVKNNLDAGSRHQRADNVLIRGEVQGDVQTLAHELYDVLLNATPDEAKSIADKYRKRFYRLLDHHKEVLSALQATVNKHVEANQKLTEIGSGHTYALSVIQDKDKQLEENKDFIAKCLAEIGNKESQLELTQQELERSQIRISEQEILNKKNAVIWDRFEELQQLVHGRELKLSESLAYIEKCEAWIGEFNVLSEDSQRILAEQRDYIARCEARIREQDQWLVDNTGYIAKCETRIREQDEGLAENRDYILRCETHIGELNEALQGRDHLLAERLDKISSYDHRMVEFEQLLVQKQEEFSGERDVMGREKENLQTRCAELEKIIDDQRQQIAEYQHQHQLNEARIQEQDGIIKERDADLLATQGRADALQQNVSASQLTIESLSQDVSAGRLTIGTLQQDVSANRSAIKALQQDLSANQSVITQRDTVIADQVKALEAAAMESENQNTRIVNLEQQIAGLLETKNHHEGEIVGHIATINTNQQHIHELETLVAGLKADMQNQSLEKESLVAEISRVQQLEALNKQRIAIQKKQIDSTKTHAAALESELVAINTQITSKQQELERYRSYRVVKLIDKFVEPNT